MVKITRTLLRACVYKIFFVPLPRKKEKYDEDDSGIHRDIEKACTDPA